MRLTEAVSNFAEPRPTASEPPVAEEEQSNAAPTEPTEAEAEDPRATDAETFEIPYNGETLNVTLDEMKKGYMLERDYQYKRGQDAEVRKALDAKASELDELLGEISAEVSGEADFFETPEAKELRELDPDAYLKRFEAAQAKKSKAQKAKEARAREKAEKRAAKQAKEVEKLAEKIPGWIDPQARQADSEAIANYLTNLFSNDEIAAIDDHRTLFMAHQNLQLQKELAELKAVMDADPASKKVENAPKSAKPGAAGNADSAQAQKQKAAKDRFKQTGKLRDAVALLRQ